MYELGDGGAFARWNGDDREALMRGERCAERIRMESVWALFAGAVIGLLIGLPVFALMA
jgi:hypothetical protein